MSKNVKTDTELFAQANIQKEAGKEKLGNFVMFQSSKSFEDLITNSWKMNDAVEKLRRHPVPCMETICQTANTECVQHCEKTWLQSAIEVLGNKYIVLFLHIPCVISWRRVVGNLETRLWNLQILRKPSS